MKKLLFLILAIISLNIYSQHKKSDKILNEGKLLYRLEKGSWYGTDLFLANYPNKRDSTGGYLSYEKDHKIYTIFFNRYDHNKVLARYKFDSIPKQKALDVELNKNATALEKELITIRLDAKKRMFENKDKFFSFYKETSPNFIPLITKNKKRVFIFTGPKTNGFVLLGNDYVLTYNKKNKFKKKEKLHNTLLQFAYKSEKKDNPTVSTMHSHVVTKYITSTDICTLLLYKDFVEWKKHIVISKKYVSIFDMKKETLFIMKRKAWDKIMTHSN